MRILLPIALLCACHAEPVASPPPAPRPVGEVEAAAPAAPAPVLAPTPSASAVVPAPSASVAPIALGTPCVPDGQARTLPRPAMYQKLCGQACLGDPSQILEVCEQDDFDDIVGIPWMVRKLKISDGKQLLFAIETAFGPSDSIDGGEEVVRLVPTLAANGLSVELVEAPDGTCAAAKKSTEWSYKSDAVYRKAVDRVCAARGRYAWKGDRFARTP